MHYEKIGQFRKWRHRKFSKSVGLTTKSGRGHGSTTKNEILHCIDDRFRHKFFCRESIYKLSRYPTILKIRASR